MVWDYRTEMRSKSFKSFFVENSPFHVIGFFVDTCGLYIFRTFVLSYTRLAAFA